MRVNDTRHETIESKRQLESHIGLLSSLLPPFLCKLQAEGNYSFSRQSQTMKFSLQGEPNILKKYTYLFILTLIVFNPLFVAWSFLRTVEKPGLNYAGLSAHVIELEFPRKIQTISILRWLTIFFFF